MFELCEKCCDTWSWDLSSLNISKIHDGKNYKVVFLFQIDVLQSTEGSWRLWGSGPNRTKLLDLEDVWKKVLDSPDNRIGLGEEGKLFQRNFH
jgi:hypothetical protein